MLYNKNISGLLLRLVGWGLTARSNKHGDIAPQRSHYTKIKKPHHIKYAKYTSEYRLYRNQISHAVDQL